MTDDINQRYGFKTQEGEEIELDGNIPIVSKLFGRTQLKYAILLEKVTFKLEFANSIADLQRRIDWVESKEVFARADGTQDEGCIYVNLETEPKKDYFFIQFFYNKSGAKSEDL